MFGVVVHAGEFRREVQNLATCSPQLRGRQLQAIILNFCRFRTVFPSIIASLVEPQHMKPLSDSVVGHVQRAHVSDCASMCVKHVYVHKWHPSDGSRVFLGVGLW